MLCCLLGLSAPLMCSPLANLLIKKKNSKSFQTWLARSFASCLHWRFASAELSSRSSAAFQQHMIFVLVFRVEVLAGSTIKQPRQDVDQHRPLATQPCLFSAPCLCRFIRFSMRPQCRLLWWPGMPICSQPHRVERDPGFGPEPRLYRATVKEFGDVPVHAIVIWNAAWWSIAHVAHVR